jgi:hypothetical protein
VHTNSLLVRRTTSEVEKNASMCYEKHLTYNFYLGLKFGFQETSYPNIQGKFSMSNPLL